MQENFGPKLNKNDVALPWQDREKDEKDTATAAGVIDLR